MSMKAAQQQNYDRAILDSLYRSIDLRGHFNFIQCTFHSSESAQLYVVPDRFVCICRRRRQWLRLFPVSRKSNQLPWPTTTTLAQIAAELTATAHE